MRFNRDRKVRRNLIMATIGIVMIVFIFRGVLNNLSAILNKVILPVKSAIYNTTKASKNTIDNLKDIDRILDENKRLNAENYRLSLDNYKLGELLEENRRLRRLLNIKEQNNLDFIIASISFRDPMSVYDQFYIDKGSRDGIKQNMVVLNNKILLGRVTKVYEQSAIVELISKDGILTSILVGEQKKLGILKGNNNDILTLEYFVKDIEINKGDLIKTSGISDIYPKGLYIGEVKSVKEDKDQLFKEIEMQLPFNIFEINEVIVLKKED